MPGADNLFEEVCVTARALPNVHFHGPLPYHETCEFYERARVLAGTSEMEGFPNTYLQAWARGTPVVAFLDPEQLLTRNAMGRAVVGKQPERSCVQEIDSKSSQLTRPTPRPPPVPPNP